LFPSSSHFCPPRKNKKRFISALPIRLFAYVYNSSSWPQQQGLALFISRGSSAKVQPWRVLVRVSGALTPVHSLRCSSLPSSSGLLRRIHQTFKNLQGLGQCSAKPGHGPHRGGSGTSNAAAAGERARRRVDRQVTRPKQRGMPCCG
jgi:hypothetical protein